MIDIHHHLLWSLDDGASNMETSVAMAKAAAADGISHIVCSPHANGKYA
jgi:protein-tyrosine phosphatase